MEIKLFRLMREKKGVSLMVSYVLLVSIAIILAILIFSWLRLTANVTPVENCEEGTSLIVSDYSCLNQGEEKQLRLSVKNSGRFSIDGFVITVGSSSEQPIHPIIPISPSSAVHPIPGKYLFARSLKPGDTALTSFADFYLKNGDEIKIDFIISNLRLQPYIISEGVAVVCDSVVHQEIENCDLR